MIFFFAVWRFCCCLLCLIFSLGNLLLVFFFCRSLLRLRRCCCFVCGGADCNRTWILSHLFCVFTCLANLGLPPFFPLPRRSHRGVLHSLNCSPSQSSVDQTFHRDFIRLVLAFFFFFVSLLQDLAHLFCCCYFSCAFFVVALFGVPLVRKKFTYNFPLDRVKLINDLHTDFFLFSVAEGFPPNCFASLILFFEPVSLW